MNGELFQICNIVASAKKALKIKSTLSYVPNKYENKIDFHFLPRRNLFLSNKAGNIQLWYDSCLKRGLHDIKLIIPVKVNDRNILGFSNTTQSSLLCFFKKGFTCFTPQWEFESSQNLWNILYTEQEWNGPNPNEIHFKNNTEEFKIVLSKIKELAHKIDCDYFADIFQKSLNILLDQNNNITENDTPLLEIPDENLRIFKSANTADVFGAMGSWNDSPPYMAHKKRLDAEYELLSTELLKQIRYAILYAINEW